MEPAEREDLLLAVIRFESRNQRSPLAEDIAGLVQRSLPDVQTTIKLLVDCGELVIDEAGFVKLTASGEAAAA
ncbi:MAG: hypothetical protein LUQ50_12955, partial [Methanospirillum sp.]|uniref:hypothetical protein n=1 Tax=Methanospirillum sp. TaxID=45200 RepID=UPI00236B5565